MMLSFEADRGLHLLAVHHEAAVAADRHHLAVGIDHLRRHRRGQAGAHRRQRIVEQHRVGLARRIIAREPDLVDAVVEADDAVRRHRLAHLLDQAGREDREARRRRTSLAVCATSAARALQHPVEIPACLTGRCPP